MSKTERREGGDGRICQSRVVWRICVTKGSEYVNVRLARADRQTAMCGARTCDSPRLGTPAVARHEQHRPAGMGTERGGRGKKVAHPREDRRDAHRGLLAPCSNHPRRQHVMWREREPYCSGAAAVAWHARRCTPRTTQAGGRAGRARRAEREGGAPARHREDRRAAHRAHRAQRACLRRSRTRRSVTPSGGSWTWPGWCRWTAFPASPGQKVSGCETLVTRPSGGAR
jgi:hypothetical protein